MTERQGALAGQVVLVTGGGRGIGAAIARGCAREGALVVVNYLNNQATAEAVAQECQTLGGDGWALPCDVTHGQAVQAMMQRIEREVGRLDVVINNAFRPYRFDPEDRERFWELQWSHYQSQLDGAVRSCFEVCQAALPLMRKRTKGSIVNLTSDLVVRPSVPYHDYTTAKSALVGFSRTLAAELGPLGIRVNCVAPGFILSAMTDALPDAQKDALTGRIPAGRLGEGADIAAGVVYLASKEASYVTGHTLHINGGMAMP